ncbi:molybdopterin converting factor subunit 1 [Gammaproteobacteria bacterium AS21]|jgi:molybdopterin synthase sulfur carrier subunit
MIKIIYFASIREALNLADEMIALPDSVSTTGQLSSWLQQERGQQWQSVLSNSNVLIAVNQEMVNSTQVICDGDEVAFFPPVTGG